MWILVAEAFGALGLLLFIVWWTLGPTHRRERDATERAKRDAVRAGDASNAAPMSIAHRPSSSRDDTQG